MNYFGCDYLISRKKNILAMFSGGGAYFKGVDDKTIMYCMYSVVSDNRFFLQFEIHIGLETSFKFTK